MLRRIMKNILNKKKWKCFMMINKEDLSSKNLTKVGNKSKCKQIIMGQL